MSGAWHSHLLLQALQGRPAFLKLSLASTHAIHDAGQLMLLLCSAGFSRFHLRPGVLCLRLCRAVITR